MRTVFPRISNYTPLATFSEQINAGMTSSQFDIEANLRDGDSRSGLDERGTQEVMEIMRQQRVKYANVLNVFYPHPIIVEALTRLDLFGRIGYSLRMESIHQVSANEA